MIDLTEIVEEIASEQWNRLAGQAEPWATLAPQRKAAIKTHLLPVIHKTAEAVEARVREQIAAEIRAIVAVGARPLARDAEVPTDFASDREWAAMLAEGSA